MILGAAPEQIDRVMFEFGLAMGPFAMADMVGLDLGGVRARCEEALMRSRQGYLTLCVSSTVMGKKTVRGTTGTEGSRTPIPDPITSEVIEKVATDLGYERKTFSDEET